MRDFDQWISREADGWVINEVGGGWSMTYGPYRWKWLAVIAAWTL